MRTLLSVSFGVLALGFAATGLQAAPIPAAAKAPAKAPATVEGQWQMTAIEVYKVEIGQGGLTGLIAVEKHRFETPDDEPSMIITFGKGGSDFAAVSGHLAARGTYAVQTGPTGPTITVTVTVLAGPEGEPQVLDEADMVTFHYIFDGDALLLVEFEPGESNQYTVLRLKRPAPAGK